MQMQRLTTSCQKLQREHGMRREGTRFKVRKTEVKVATLSLLFV